MYLIFSREEPEMLCQAFKSDATSEAAEENVLFIAFYILLFFFFIFFSLTK